MLALMLALTFVLVAMLVYTSVTLGHHTGVACGGAGGRALCLPYSDTSYAVKTLQATNELTYCFNQRASFYPGFVSQVREVNAQQSAALGVRWREVGGVYQSDSAARSAGCQVWHSMPESHGCQECAAWVHYLNAPVIVEYRYQAGYTDWKTTIAHEQGHIYGLHEKYDDANFQSFRGSYGYWAHGLNTSPGTASDARTVMDFGMTALLGNLAWQFSEFDVKYACQNLDRNGQRLPACGYQEPPPPPVCVPVVGAPCWNGEAWLFHDGGAFIPNGGCGVWYDALRRPTWGDCDYSWGARYHGILRVWAGTERVFHPESNTWYEGTIRQP